MIYNITYSIMPSIRIWSMRFDSNCADECEMIMRPCTNMNMDIYGTVRHGTSYESEKAGRGGVSPSLYCSPDMRNRNSRRAFLQLVRGSETFIGALVGGRNLSWWSSRRSTSRGCCLTKGSSVGRRSIPELIGSQFRGTIPLRFSDCSVYEYECDFLTDNPSAHLRR